MASVLNQPAAGLITFHQRNAEASVWVGNLDPQVTEEIITELMVQVAPVVSVGMPRDKVTGTHSGYAFIEFETVDDADYAIRIMNSVQLYGKPIRVNKAYKEDKKTQEKQMWQALLFIGNLAPDVDEGVLSKIFSAFGAVLTVNVDRNEEGASKGYGFVQFDSFESADSAIESMDRQYVHNQQIHVQYARRKDSDTGERHGSEAERRMAKLAQASLVKGGSFAGRRPTPVSAPVVVTDLPGVGTNLPSSTLGRGYGTGANRMGVGAAQGASAAAGASGMSRPYGGGYPPPPTMISPPPIPPMAMGMGMGMGMGMPPMMPPPMGMGMPPVPPPMGMVPPGMLGMPAMGMGMTMPPPPPPMAMGAGASLHPPPFAPPPMNMISPPPFRPPPAPTGYGYK